jgi:hypothetical protein
MNKIENVNQLDVEIKRLRTAAKEQEVQLKNHLKDIREDFRPENILINSLASVTGIKIDKKEFFKEGLAYALSIIIQRFVLKTERKIEDRTYEFLDNVFERIKRFMGKHTSTDAKREQRKEDKNEASV